MTLPSTTVRDPYNGDGATTSFPVTFVFWADDDVTVVHTDANGTETTWTKGTEYTITGGDGSTGTVTVSTSPTDYTPASGEKLTIRSSVGDTQDTRLPAGGSLPAGVMEIQLDKIVRMIQEKEESLGRAVKFSVSSADSGVSFPDVTGNDGKFIRVNSGATGLEAVTVADADAITLPGSSTDNGIPMFDGTGGDSMQSSGLTGDDNSGLTVPGTLKLSKGADVASAAALSLGTDGNYFDVTGTTAITSIGSVAIGTWVVLQFDGALTLTHHATDLILPTAANITTAAGDHAIFVEYASGDWRCVSYMRADGSGLDPDLLKADTSDDLTAGFTSTSSDQGTKSSGTFTPDFTTRNVQRYVNGGAHTLAPPSSGEGTMVLQMTNDGSAGAVTTSGFTKVTGDSIGTTNGDDYLLYVTRINGFSHLHVVAMQ